MVSSHYLRKYVENVYRKLLSNISNAFGEIILLPSTNQHAGSHEDI